MIESFGTMPRDDFSVGSAYALAWDRLFHATNGSSASSATAAGTYLIMGKLLFL